MGIFFYRNWCSGACYDWIYIRTWLLSSKKD